MNWWNQFFSNLLLSFYFLLLLAVLLVYSLFQFVIIFRNHRLLFLWANLKEYCKYLLFLLFLARFIITFSITRPDCLKLDCNFWQYHMGLYVLSLFFCFSSISTLMGCLIDSIMASLLIFCLILLLVYFSILIFPMCL